MKKILIVDDEIISAVALKYDFEKLGYSVCNPVSTGQKAIRAAETERPDYILMDIRLRGEMNGIQAAGLIKERYNIPSLLMTGYDQNSIKVLAGSNGIPDVIEKPVNAMTIHTFLEKKKGGS